MAVTAKDGSHHHSASRALLHDEMAASRGKSSGVVQKKDSADKGPGEPANKSHIPGPTETPIADHVMEHGPAHTVHYSHDEATGKHTVTSYHGDAKPLDGMGGGDSAEGSEHMNHPGVHHSVHKTHHAAHEHMGSGRRDAGFSARPNGGRARDTGPQLTRAMPWTRKAVKFLFSSGSPLSTAQKDKMHGELHANPAMGHARKGSAELKKPSRMAAAMRKARR
jgi:hypothetical protein